MTLTLSTKAKVALAAVIAAVALLLSPVAFAHGGNDGDDDKDKRGNNGLHLGAWFKSHLDTNGGEISKEEKEQKRQKWADLRGNVNVGVVTSVDGSVFTIDPAGNKSTTTVTTNGDTTVKGGDLDDLEVGSRVVVVGTTTATNADGDSVVASWIKIVGEGFGKLGGKLGLWLGLR